VKTGHLQKAEEPHNVLIGQTSDEVEKAIYYNNLGCIKNDQDDYEKAIEYHEKAIELRQKNSSTR
jgi:tetratricopeptide (TPR) repeat protein